MKKAFTLIELLIVIAIIGILAGILFVSIGQTPLIKSRDAKRISELQAIRTALTLYYTDNNAYPVSGKDGIAALVTGNYLQVQPKDPRHDVAGCALATYDSNANTFPTVASADGNYAYRYEQQLSGQDYLLQACLELATNPALATDANTSNSPVYDISP